MSSQAFDVAIVGGGIAGGALACVLARGGKSVLLLERSETYVDRVRGEYMQPWGVAETQRLGLIETFLEAGATFHSRYVPYDETLEPKEAEAAAVPLNKLLPDVPGTIGVGHPAACEALSRKAEREGALVVRGVEDIKPEPGDPIRVGYRRGLVEHSATCRLVVGADGRESRMRRLAGIDLQATQPRLLGSGLLVEHISGWPEGQVVIGTESDLVFFILPQKRGRARLYLMFDTSQRRRFAGRGAARTFLASFPFACVPGSDHVARAKPAGPCATFPMNDTWTESPVAEGFVLIGDAAGHSDPHLGQGLSVAMRDVRVLSELLLDGDDWSPGALSPYVHERTERMRRLRFCNAVATTLRGEFGPDARERRKLGRRRMLAHPDLALWRAAAFAGPETAPASAFDEEVATRLFAPPSAGT